MTIQPSSRWLFKRSTGLTPSAYRRCSGRFPGLQARGLRPMH